MKCKKCGKEMKIVSGEGSFFAVYFYVYYVCETCGLVQSKKCDFDNPYKEK